MHVTPTWKQFGRRGKREPMRVIQQDPAPVTLSEDERKRRLYNRGW